MLERYQSKGIPGFPHYPVEIVQLRLKPTCKKGLEGVHAYARAANVLSCAGVVSAFEGRMSLRSIAQRLH